MQDSGWCTKHLSVALKTNVKMYPDEILFSSVSVFQVADIKHQFYS